MKKILSLVLAASMVFGSAGFAMAAPADVEGTKYEDAVNRLQALEILNGYEDGTFRPEKTITRAEFAKIMVTTLGVGDAAKYASGETKFNDVASNHWAAGYVNVASDMGIINGYGDGNFGPSDEVTYAQAITMIVRGLGYEPKATALGGYPGGYIAIASEKDITDDVKVVNSLAANRGDVATMVDNSLDVPMMVQVKFGNDPQWEEDENKTILKDKHDIEEIKGFVTATPRTDDSLEENELKVGTDKYELLGDTNTDKLLGVEVKVWANDDDEVFFVEVETDEDDIIFDTIEKVAGDTITLEVEDEDYDLASDATVTVNFDSSVDETDLAAGQYGYVVLNDKGDVQSINVIDGKEIADGVVYEINEDEVKFVDTTDASEDDVDFSDYEDGVVVFDANFNVVEKDSIKKNTAIYAFEDGDTLYVVTNNVTVEGELGSVKSDEFKIAGKKYDAAENLTYSTNNLDGFETFSNVDDLDDLNGEEVVAVLDLSGDVILVHGDVEETSSTMYGIVTYGETRSISEATIFNKDGNETNYKFEDRTEGSALANLNYFEKDAALTFAIMEYSLNSDGEIAEAENTITTIDMSGTFKTVTKDADEDYVMFDGNRYYISEDTVFMTALDGGELDPEVLTYTNIYESDIATNGEAIVIGEAGKDADMIVFLNSDFEGTNDDYYYGIVTDEASKSGSDYMITVYVAGEGEKEIVIDSSDIATLTEGKIIEFKYDSKGELDLSTDRVEETIVIGTDADTVDYDGGYVEITQAGNTDYVKVANDLVVYQTDADGNLDGKTKISKIDGFNTIKLIKDEDGMIISVVLMDEK